MRDITDDLELEEMVSYRKNVTGISHTVFISPRGNAKHGPRVKVAINPPDSLAPFGEIATVAFDGTVIGNIPLPLLTDVREFITINSVVLLDYWHYRIDTSELQQRLRSI